MYLKICCGNCIVGGHYINHQFQKYVDSVDYKNGLQMGYLSVFVEKLQRFVNGIIKPAVFGSEKPAVF